MPRKFTHEEAVTILRECNPDFQPTSIYPGASIPWAGIHLPCGKPNNPLFQDLRVGKKCCTYCSGNGALTPEDAVLLVKELCPDFFPTSKYPGAGDKQWLGVHTLCNTPVTPTLHSLKKGYGCCVLCGQENAHKNNIGKYLYTHDEAVAKVKEFCPTFIPTTRYPGSNNKWKGIHTDCRQPCYPTFARLREGENCCARCSRKHISEFNRLYIVEGIFQNEHWCKIGVSSIDSRVINHKRNGWNLSTIEWFLDHSIVWYLEYTVKACLKKHDWAHLDKNILPQGGYTETFPKRYLGVVISIINYEINLLI